MILARRLVRPANKRCKMPMKMWPMGADTKAPNMAILGTREVK